MTEKNHKADLLAALSLQEEMGATALLDNTPRKRTAPTGKIGGKVEGKAQSRAEDRAGGKAQDKPQGKIGGKAQSKPQDAAGVDAMGAEDMGAGSTAGKSTPPRRAKKPVFSAEIAEAQKLAAQADSLEALWQTIAAFEGCNLRAGANNTVIWRGNATARLAIVGEAPGADEDAQGKPFVGRAGKLLDGLLHWAGFDESQVFITNVVFWRPPKNRAPEPAEVSVCLPFVWKQLALLKPENCSATREYADESSIAPTRHKRNYPRPRAVDKFRLRRYRRFRQRAQDNASRFANARLWQFSSCLSVALATANPLRLG